MAFSKGTIRSQSESLVTVRAYKIIFIEICMYEHEIIQTLNKNLLKNIMLISEKKEKFNMPRLLARPKKEQHLLTNRSTLRGVQIYFILFFICNFESDSGSIYLYHITTI